MRTPPRKTLWEEGRQPGRRVRTVAVGALALVAAVDVLATGQLSVGFDLAFVLLCVGAALAVRPRDFFVVGVLPPLMMLGAVLLLALTFRTSVADDGDGLVQAVVSGLAHHAGALVTGYALALVVLALRQVAIRNAGTLRGVAPAPRSRPAQVAPAAPTQARPAAPVVRTERPVPAPEAAVADGSTAAREGRAATGT